MPRDSCARDYALRTPETLHIISTHCYCPKTRDVRKSQYRDGNLHKAPPALYHAKWGAHAARGTGGALRHG